MQRARSAATTPPGSYIYAYCHVRTNQVLYSLTKTLNSAHLKQLPDVGANNTPASFRKDSWRPLFTVSMPQDEAGYKHGLYIMQKLRELRRLHELNWKPSPLMSRPYNQTEIYEMQKRLDTRGGAKRETVYDIIKRKKWAMRVRSVMDQKANSIADLAAILEETEERAKKAIERNEKTRLKHKELSHREMLDLEKKAATGEVAVLERRRAQLQSEVANVADKHKSRVQREIDGLNLKIEMMRFASKAVTDARVEAEKQAAAELAKDEAAEAETGSTVVSDAPTEATLKPQKKELDLPPWPEHIDPWLVKANAKGKKIPKGLANREVLQFDRPIHSNEGIIISWANYLDQEYANEWPESIEWRPMALTRHGAQIPLRSPLDPNGEANTSDGSMDIATLVQSQFSHRRRQNVTNREREDFLEKIKNDVMARITSDQAQDDNSEDGATATEPPESAEQERRPDTII